MQERNIVSGAAAAVLSPFVDSWPSMLAWLLVAVVLLFADLRFGIQAAARRGERIRGSRAVRRTLNKFVDYICWVSIAWVMGASFGRVLDVPVLAAVIMLVICLIEITSIFDNYFECHGLHMRFNAWKFFGQIFKVGDLGDCIETDEGKGKEGKP